MKRKSLWIIVAALIVSGSLGYWFFGKQSDAPAQPGGGRRADGGGRPLPVLAAAARKGEIDVVINALGTVTARNTATVKARVDGQLIRIAFREGQLVKEGDLLAEIDPRPFQVQLDQASGQLARDQALLANAKLDAERYSGLLAKDSIAKQQVDAQESLVRQYEGVVQTDRAQVDNAKLQLGFTHVTAPIAGRLGLRLVDLGNMVHASDANGLVVITQTQPIAAVFAIPSDDLPAVLARLHAGDALAVDAYDRDGKRKLAAGKLLTADNQIDVTTGTVKLKAEFANADNALFPNQFVNARLRVETRHGATLVPVAAIQRGTQGTFVYVIDQEPAVSIRPVVLGPALGDIVSIEKGLTPGEQVVIDGADKLREGAKVAITQRDAGQEKKGPRKEGESGGEHRKGGAAGSGAGASPAKPAPTAPETAARPDNPHPAAPGGWQGLSDEERQKRWAETNARIDRGEFGEEIRKLPEEGRKQRMRELRRQRAEGGPASQDRQ